MKSVAITKTWYNEIKGLVKMENEYFYTYILNLYKRIYLKKLESEFTEGSNLKNVRKKFIEFTKKIWIQEVTDDEIGANINFKFSKIFELDRLYLELKNINYKEVDASEFFWDF